MNWQNRYVKEAESAAEFQRRQQRIRNRQRNQLNWKHQHPELTQGGVICEAPDCNRRHPFGRRWKMEPTSGLRLCTTCTGRVCGARGCVSLAPIGESWPTRGFTNAKPSCPNHI